MTNVLRLHYDNRWGSTSTRVVAIAALGLAACSGGGGAVGLCDRVDDVREAIEASDLDDPVALAGIAETLRSIGGDPQLRSDLQLLATVVDLRASVAELPSDADAVAALDAEIAAVEARADDLATAQVRVRLAVNGCDEES